MPTAVGWDSYPPQKSAFARCTLTMCHVCVEIQGLSGPDMQMSFASMNRSFQRRQYFFAESFLHRQIKGSMPISCNECGVKTESNPISYAEPELTQPEPKNSTSSALFYRFIYRQKSNLANSATWHDSQLTRTTGFHHHQLIVAFKSPP